MVSRVVFAFVDSPQPSCTWPQNRHLYRQVAAIANSNTPADGLCDREMLLRRFEVVVDDGPVWCARIFSLLFVLCLNFMSISAEEKCLDVPKLKRNSNSTFAR